MGGRMKNDSEPIFSLDDSERAELWTDMSKE